MSWTESYADFVASKAKSAVFGGIADAAISESLYPHQRDLTSWALRKGRAAIFADTGLGKTAMQLEWARHVSRRGRVLIMAPLAVAHQTVEEGRSLGLADAVYLREDDASSRIVVTNYEMMDRFSPDDFAGIVLDESSILKSFTGKTRNELISRFGKTPYRLACTATPAPNDFTELGNHSEFLGVKTRTEMLAEYFVHDMDTTQDWRLKGHAVGPFWRWVATWGAVVRTPSDLGYNDTRYTLPPIRMHDHVVPVDHKTAWAAGNLFAVNAVGLDDQRKIRKATIDGRVNIARSIIGEPGPCIVWCESNAESEAIAAATPDCVEVTGSQSPDVKTDLLMRFTHGEARVMVTKPSIAGFGLNWQHCSRMIFVGASHSYEQTYQAIRRCWRFGQTRPVDVHMIRAETEQLVIDNYRRKEADAERMAAEMTAHVGAAVRAEVVSTSTREWNDYSPSIEMTKPQWETE